MKSWITCDIERERAARVENGELEDREFGFTNSSKKRNLIIERYEDVYRYLVAGVIHSHTN